MLIVACSATERLLATTASRIFPATVSAPSVSSRSTRNYIGKLLEFVATDFMTESIVDVPKVVRVSGIFVNGV